MHAHAHMSSSLFCFCMVCMRVEHSPQICRLFYIRLQARTHAHTHTHAHNQGHAQGLYGSALRALFSMCVHASHTTHHYQCSGWAHTRRARGPEPHPTTPHRKAQPTDQGQESDHTWHNNCHNVARRQRGLPTWARDNGWGSGWQGGRRRLLPRPLKVDAGPQRLRELRYLQAHEDITHMKTIKPPRGGMLSTCRTLLGDPCPEAIAGRSTRRQAAL